MFLDNAQTKTLNLSVRYLKTTEPLNQIHSFMVQSICSLHSREGLQV